MASAERYPPRTCSMTFGRAGAVSAASAGPTHSEIASQRYILENLECGRFGLAGQHVPHADLPAARRIVDRDRKDFSGVTLSSQQIPGVIIDGLPRWIHDIHMQHVVRGGSRSGEADAEGGAVAALYTRR